MTTRHFLCVLTLLISYFTNNTYAQNLSFSAPVNFLPSATTNEAIDITQFKGNFFTTWTATNGNVHVAYIGSDHSRNVSQQDAPINGAQSSFGPVLRPTTDHIYALWIAQDGSIQYTFNTSDTSFSKSAVRSLSLPNAQPLAMGLTSAYASNNRIVIGVHAQNKDGLFYTVATIAADGQLTATELKKIPAKSADYPFVVALSDNTVRFTWRGNKDMGIYYADADLTTDKFTDPKQLYQAQTTRSPAIYNVFDINKLFYLWKGGKNDNKVYYTTEEHGKLLSAETELPGYFTTQNPVSVCNVNSKKFILAYAGTDKKLYLSYFTSYDPARWMETTLYPHKADYSLKDIVIPGSHDAGMSVLTATGGQQAGTINDCNTLTQTQNVKAQLNSGLRMFDIRVGLYNKQIYTKHASSDCMDQAIGGGFGEKFSTILYDLKDFLHTNKKETVIFTLSHFCEKETPVNEVAKFIIDTLGRDLIFFSNGRKLPDVKLSELAGKAVIVFEDYKGGRVDSCSLNAVSNCFINVKREYAATNVLDNLIGKEKAFFTLMGNNQLRHNDWVRLDWQLTQSTDEAAMVCNNFQSEKMNPLVDGVLLLTSSLRKHKSIRDLSVIGNRSLALTVNQWISDGTINKNNKPNVLYVDMAGSWITDYCIQLNETKLYTQ